MPGAADRQRHVERLALELRLERRLLQHRPARRERLGHRVLERVDRRALRLALVGRELAEGGQERGDRALLAERGDPHRLQRRFVASGFDRGERFVLQDGEVGHGGP